MYLNHTNSFLGLRQLNVKQDVGCFTWIMLYLKTFDEVHLIEVHFDLAYNWK